MVLTMRKSFLFTFLIILGLSAMQAQSLKMGKEAYEELKGQFDASNFSTVYAQNTPLIKAKVSRIGHEVSAFSALTPASKLVYVKALCRKQVARKVITKYEATLFVRIQTAYMNKDLQDIFSAGISLASIDRKSPVVAEYCRQLDQQSQNMGYDNAINMYNELKSMSMNVNDYVYEIGFPFDDPNNDISDPMGINALKDQYNMMAPNNFDLSGDNHPFGNGALNASGGGGDEEPKYHIDDDEASVLIGLSTLGYGTAGAIIGGAVAGPGGAATGFGIGATIGGAGMSVVVGGLNILFSGSVVDPCAMNGNSPEDCPPGIGY